MKTEDDGPEIAEVIKPSDVARFRRIARSMQRLLDDIRAYCPGANLYLEDGDSWHLMTGPSHDDGPRGRMVSRQDRSAAHEMVHPSGGGAW